MLSHLLVRAGGAGQLHIAFDAAGVALGQLHLVVGDVGGRQFGQQHVAGDAAVVPPVGVDGRDLVLVAAVVGLDDDEVAALGQLAGDVELEGREAALVHAELLAVQVDVGFVVDRAEVQHIVLARLRIGLEHAAHPDGAFVQLQALGLRIPVAGYLEGRRLVETVFDPVALVLRLAVVVEAALAAGRRVEGHTAVIVEAGLVGIDDVVPAAVQALVAAALDVLERRRQAVGVRRCGRRAGQLHVRRRGRLRAGAGPAGQQQRGR
jgi:hypothetical protein